MDTKKQSKRSWGDLGLWQRGPSRISLSANPAPHNAGAETWPRGIKRSSTVAISILGVPVGFSHFGGQDSFQHPFGDTSESGGEASKRSISVLGRVNSWTFGGGGGSITFGPEENELKREEIMWKGTVQEESEKRSQTAHRM
eukprot:3478489-Amphidinium_carterae.1